MASRESVARSERLGLCALLEEKGPLAPTLCEGWTTADLAAHLYIREARPWAGVGILLPPLAGVTERAMDSAKRSLGYEALIRKVLAGPPAIAKPLDKQMNTVEFFVHHEDVRRAADPGAGSRDDVELDEALWSNLQRGAWLMTRKLKGVGLELEAPGHGSFTARKGTPQVKITGSPQELMLYLFGRKSAAKVELEGPESAKTTVEEASLGL